MVRWTAMLGVSLLMAGCAADDLGDGAEGPGGATESSEGQGAPEEVGEAAQALEIGEYFASDTDNALDEANVEKFPIVIGANQAVMIATDEITGAFHDGDTVLRLFAPTGDQVKGNDNYACSPDLGSLIAYKSPYAQPKTFTLWAGCHEDETCGSNMVAISRRKLLFDFKADNTKNATKNVTKDSAYFTAGRTIRASTCGKVAAGATHAGDTFLRLYRKDGGTYFQVAWNDNNNDNNLNNTLCDSSNCDDASTILYEVPSDGTYEVRVGCHGNEKCHGTVAVYVE